MARNTSEAFGLESFFLRPLNAHCFRPCLVLPTPTFAQLFRRFIRLQVPLCDLIKRRVCRRAFGDVSFAPPLLITIFRRPDHA